ncbi:hypothetical protein GCM10011374_22560 [Kocuria dechangensis]|uniref:Uncharacterized protein n=1 Tax=Kocuria dechangensis TaxID=1176249 RepID=A0A917GWA3_9MICC|nr:hypothetical protein [Kocuria dechangensis]GGG59159.1 hypothetical protein GCM10011374_22560 [Kocuria dechangensis]
MSVRAFQPEDLNELREVFLHTRAVSFFESVGFVRHGDPALIPGLREHGRRIHQQTMVRLPCQGGDA